MNSSKKLLILVVCLILLLAGAYILYDKLSAGRRNNLETLENLTASSAAGTLPGAAGWLSTETAEGAGTSAESTPEKTAAPQETDTEKETETVTETVAVKEEEPSRETRPSSETGKEAVQQVPDITFYTAQGEELHLSDFFGKPIILNFWASWCGPCQMEMPHLQTQYEALGEEIHFILIDLTDGVSETQKTAQAFIDSAGYTFPVYFDIGSQAAATYGAYSIPLTFFINADGVGVARALGSMDAETLQKGIDLIRAK